MRLRVISGDKVVRRGLRPLDMKAGVIVENTPLGIQPAWGGTQPGSIMGLWDGHDVYAAGEFVLLGVPPWFVDAAGREWSASPAEVVGGVPLTVSNVAVGRPVLCGRVNCPVIGWTVGWDDGLRFLLRIGGYSSEPTWPLPQPGRPPVDVFVHSELVLDDDHWEWEE